MRPEFLLSVWMYYLLLRANMRGCKTYLDVLVVMVKNYGVCLDPRCLVR